MGKPKIRFEGYSEDWEQRKFGEIVEKYEDPVETPTEGYTRLGIRSHAKGTFHSYVEKGKELETAKMFRVAADKFIVNITFGWEHAVAITDENDAGKLVSHRFPQYSFNAGMDPKFFRYLILDENFKHHLELSSPGGAGRNRVLKLSDMLEYKMIFPSEAEQRKIATYFDDLDHLITLHQRKCEETKTLKKYMLQKMFPQNGHSVPEIRFSGFTEDWEQRKLGDLIEDNIIIEQSDGNHGELYPRSDEFTDAGIPYIAASAISSSGDDIDFNLVKYLPLKRAEQFRKGVAQNGDILLAHNATVGPCLQLSMEYDFAILSTSLTLFRINENKMNSKFFLQMLRSDLFQNQLFKYMKQTTRSQVPILTQRKLEVCYPNNTQDQELIGTYLSNLDHLITLHQRKCNELKEIKKYMLQNMFV